MAAETDIAQISWIRIATICFAAGGLYSLVSMNTGNIEKIVNSQVQSNKELSRSIVDLNMTVVQLRNSIDVSNVEIKEMKTRLSEHDKEIANNHEELIKLRMAPSFSK